MSRTGRVRAIKVERRKGYESISRDSLQDRRLSYKARGIMAYLKSMPPDWETSTEDIADASDKDGYEAVNSGIKELEAVGLFARLKRQGKDGRWEWLWVYSDDPDAVTEAVAKWNAKYGARTSPRGGNTRAKGRPDQQKKIASSMSGFSGHGEPGSGSPVHGEPPNKEIYSQVEPPLPPASGGSDEVSPEDHDPSEAAPSASDVCAEHSRRNCRPCGLSPRAQAWAERDAAEAEAKAELEARRRCGMCDAAGIRLAPDSGLPLIPYTRCDHKTSGVTVAAALAERERRMEEAREQAAAERAEREAVERARFAEAARRGRAAAGAVLPSVPQPPKQRAKRPRRQFVGDSPRDPVAVS